MKHNPAPWWYRAAERICPGRCREIPEAQSPDRIVLRQVALVKRYAYLQQFASSEDANWMHSHQWLYTFALGLWGGYIEWRRTPSGALHARKRTAPYAYWMDDTVVHQVLAPAPGHTSIFIGLFRDDDLKYYHHTHGTHAPRLWSDHIKVMVKRI